MASNRVEDEPTDRNPLLRKLDNVTRLSGDDRAALADACRDTREFAAHHDIISEGDKPDHVHLILDGWAARYKVVPDGARQITAYLIPGDFCDLHVTILREMDHGIAALTPVTAAFIPHDRMEALTRQRPALTRALWWATLVDEAVLRAWIVNLGRRDAYQSVAHLMCELHVRMKNIGSVTEGKFDLPLTQEEIADTLGLTPVHTNRVLQRLRGEGLIELKARQLTILDGGRLRQAAGFDPNYLHSRQQVRD
ncbi:MAG TPA: Crp/Fnr family transcriptional regulator [Allosphingosinicella sp.]|nr:Crp/Fnr family transcriptional regulator [Allosphingosinicella sp.]